MPRKPAISTQLKNAKIEIEEMKNTIADLEKKLEAETKNKDAHYKKTRELEAEIEQIHCILDNVPNPVSRKTGSDNDNSWERTELKLQTRFGAWLSVR